VLTRKGIHACGADPPLRAARVVMYACIAEKLMPLSRMAIWQYRFGHQTGMPSAATVSTKRSPFSKRSCSVRNGVFSAKVRFRVVPGLNLSALCENVSLQIFRG
jgi:hypothetical protein